MKTLLSNSGKSIIINKDDYRRCMFAYGITPILADAEKVKITDLLKNEDDIIEYLDLNNINYVQLSGDDCFYEPEKNEYIVVYSIDDDIKIGDDPYTWNYDLYSYSYWDGSNFNEEVFDDVEDCKEVHTHDIDWEQKQKNYGRDITYTVYKTETGDFYGVRDNSGYFNQTTAIKINFDVSMNDAEIEEEIDNKIAS